MIKQFEGWSRADFFAIDLLRARQCQLEGKHDKAAAFYQRLLSDVREQGPDFLLDVLLEEMPVAGSSLPDVLKLL
jgi:hypothetical protein